MVKKKTTKRHRTTAPAPVTVKKSPVKSPKTLEKVRHHDEPADARPKYRHYSSYQPSKPTNFAISRRETKPAQPAKRRTRAENSQRRRIIATVLVCLLVISGAIAAKFLISNDKPEPTNQTKVSEIKQSTDIEKPPVSAIEQKKTQAEQNLNAAANLIGSSSFSTDSVIKLKIPIYRQVYQQSCEAASLRMALAYRQIQTTDLKILELMKYDNQPAKKVGGAWQWGDPHQMFVGDKNGDQTKMTGYGVFGEPIAAASEQLGRPAAVNNAVKPEWLAQQIYAGNPVVLWGVSVKISDTKWTTPAGKEITAPIRTHTRLVVGVKGDPSRPTGFYLNDPVGKEIYWTTAQLNVNVAAGVGQGVAIY
jgi:uncharacterized protein YvpB